MSALLHFSEDPTIRVFEPHYPLGKENERPRVWTIDEAHAPLYWFPRDCPRAAWWALPTTSAQDAAHWLGSTAATMVIAFENAWLERVRQCQLFVYRFAPEAFEDTHDHGCHVAYETVTPLGLPEPVGDLLSRQAERGVELRLTPNLWPLHRALVPTTLHWSFIRMRNAQPEASAS